MLFPSSAGRSGYTVQLVVRLSGAERPWQEVADALAAYVQAVKLMPESHPIRVDQVEIDVPMDDED